METLPVVLNLRSAVLEVIKNNKNQGYPPNRFAQMVNVADFELPAVCSRLVTSQDALGAMYTTLIDHPRLLTLEDFISEYGQEWGFSEEIVEEANRRRMLYDEIAKRKRFA